MVRVVAVLAIAFAALVAYQIGCCSSGCFDCLLFAVMPTVVDEMVSGCCCCHSVAADLLRHVLVRTKPGVISTAAAFKTCMFLGQTADQ